MSEEAARVAELETALQERDAEIERLTGLLAAHRDRLERLFQANPVPLFVLSEAGEVVNVNKRARQTLGRSRAGLVGTPLSSHVDPSWRQRLTAHLRHASETGREVAEMGLLTVDGKTLFARLETTAVRDEAGSVLLVALLVLTEDAENLRLVGDTYDAGADRIRTFSDRYGRE